MLLKDAKTLGSAIRTEKDNTEVEEIEDEVKVTSGVLKET